MPLGTVSGAAQPGSASPGPLHLGGEQASASRLEQRGIKGHMIADCGTDEHPLPKRLSKRCRTEKTEREQQEAQAKAVPSEQQQHRGHMLKSF